MSYYIVGGTPLPHKYLWTITYIILSFKIFKTMGGNFFFDQGS